MRDRDPHDETVDALTESERAQFKRLARARTPSARLESETMKNLRRRGLLQRTVGARARLVGLAAAAVIVFAAGMLVGYRAALGRAPAVTAAATTGVIGTEPISVHQLATGGHVVWY